MSNSTSYCNNIYGINSAGIVANLNGSLIFSGFYDNNYFLNYGSSNSCVALIDTDGFVASCTNYSSGCILNISTIQPTTAIQSTVQPTTDQPTSVQPSIAQPTTAQPSIAQPTTAQPVTETPTSNSM